MKKRIITISREFGSGGRTIGRIVAERLGYKFYDSEMIDRVVELSGLSREIVEKYDEYAKISLREIKDSMVKRFKSGSLAINGKYTFLLPDFYAACEYWFLGDRNPNGLLANDEVFCWLFRKSEKLDCLRSPHLFLEHAIRRNVAWSGVLDKRNIIREWFATDAIYTSCKDVISKILQ